MINDEFNSAELVAKNYPNLITADSATLLSYPEAQQAEVFPTPFLHWKHHS
jgi:hypothetical protein